MQIHLFVAILFAILISVRVFYNSLEDIEDAIRSLNRAALGAFDASCFDGRYVTPEVTEQFLEELEAHRGAGRTGAVAQAGSTRDTHCDGGGATEGVGSVRFPGEGEQGSVCEILFNEG